MPYCSQPIRKMTVGFCRSFNRKAEQTPLITGNSDVSSINKKSRVSFSYFGQWKEELQWSRQKEREEGVFFIERKKKTTTAQPTLLSW